MVATAEKLHAALDRLLREGEQRLTVAALAREAHVGRNAIYANHRDILDDLNRARQRQRVPDRITTIEERIAEQRNAIEDMQQQIRQLATDNAGLMRRAIEAERRADRADRRCVQLTKDSIAIAAPCCCDRQKVSTGTMLDDAVILPRFLAAPAKHRQCHASRGLPVTSHVRCWECLDAPRHAVPADVLRHEPGLSSAGLS
ncbi:hypothetical protein ACRQ5Q_08710 [Bradyrhizobium sp. PMVTL-01]|uniref:hypothetical protein n=1 Tax=Bradyrhizobium sp. PMVTL-01 TaxID=3434999 RepID=UPI003F702EF5